MASEFRVALDELRFLPNVAAGMNIFTISSMVPLMRNSTEDYDPILVGSACGDCGTRTILDGRHRVVASLMAGRRDILAVEED